MSNKRGKIDAYDYFYFLGSLVVSGGVYWIHNPSGVIVFGISLLYVAFARGRK